MSYHAITLLKKPSLSVDLADMIQLHCIGQDLVGLHELLLPWCSLTLISQPKFQDVCHESQGFCFSQIFLAQQVCSDICL